MRYSVASQALCGAITVFTMAGSTMAVPCTHGHGHSHSHSKLHKHAQQVDISNFKSFPTADPKVFFDKSDEAVREFFNVGMFDDGPMDKAGKWTDRPVALLKNVGDQMELQFEQIREHFEEFQEKIEDHFEDLAEEAKDRQEAAAKQRLDVVKAKHEMLAKWKDQVKSHLGANKAQLWFPDFTEIFGGKLPIWQHQEEPSPPEETEQPVQSTSIQIPTTIEVSSTATQSTQTSTTTVVSTSTVTQSTQVPTTTTTVSSTIAQTTQVTTTTTTSSTVTQAPTSSTQTSEPTKAPESPTCDPSNANVRLEWSSYSRSDRTAFVKAIKCLQQKPSGGSQFTGSTSRYEDLVSVHRGMTANVHQTSTFLVWHRYFVWVFEQMLRNECGFDRALPWWDETKHAGNFAGSDIFSDEWFGHLPKISPEGRGTCIESGEFTGTTLHVGPGMENEQHCLSRALDETSTAQCNTAFTNSCLSQKTYDEFRDCFELGPHGYGHNGIGAVMAEVSASVGDPIFFMHHSFVDHTFRIWQNANPARRSEISGCANNASPCTTITLDTVLSSSGLGPDLAVRDVLDTLSGAVCYRYNY